MVARRHRLAALPARLAPLAALALGASLLVAPPAVAAGPAAPGAKPAAKKVKACPARSVTVVAGTQRAIPIRCRLANSRRAREVNRSRARIAKRPTGGRIVGVNQRRNRVRYRARPGFSGMDRFVVVRRSRGKRWRMRVVVGVRGPVDSVLSCAETDVTANYQTPVEVNVTCTGTGLDPLEIVADPAHGALSDVSESGTSTSRILTATYTPADLYVGDDGFSVAARDARGGSLEAEVGIDVRPWRMRAIGDSVTAGFGYFGDGEEMSLTDLPDCIPPVPVNNRCSSNSDAGPSHAGPPSWSADFGLANDVSWAAQFANDWQGGGHITAPVMFQNRAVTGSAPSDWLPGGELNDELGAIVDENPDLVVMTIGANPLLSDILESAGGESCFDSEDVEELLDCVSEYFEQANLPERLPELFETLLEASDAEVVVLQYHLALPSVTLFNAWQVEALGDHLNSLIAAAVAATKVSLPAAKADRLTLIEAQTEPGDTDPAKIARFNLGLPPDPPYQTWSPTYDCGVVFDDLVDGPSHQSDPTQDELEAAHLLSFCSGDPWIIDADTGIHPSRDGYAQFAAALTHVATANDLVPTLP